MEFEGLLKKNIISLFAITINSSSIITINWQWGSWTEQKYLFEFFISLREIWVKTWKVQIIFSLTLYQWQSSPVIHFTIDIIGSSNLFGMLTVPIIAVKLTDLRTEKVTTGILRNEICILNLTQFQWVIEIRIRLSLYTR